MNEDNGVRFLFDTPEAKNFIYKPPNVTDSNIPKAQKATIGVKFAQGIHFLDPWGFMLIGKTKWQRIVFRLKHPFAYTKRCYFKWYRKIKSIFIKGRMVPCFPWLREWKTKEELLKEYPKQNSSQKK